MTGNSTPVVDEGPHRRWTASTLRKSLVLVALLIAVTTCVGCGDDQAPPGSEPGSNPTGESAAGGGVGGVGNPDRNQWRDLSQEPFDPTRVGGTLVVGMGNAPPTLNNLLWSDGITRTYLKQYLCPTLLLETPDSGPEGIKAVPNAAASLPRVHADGRTYSWTIRDDLTWSDGVPLTAKDYAFTWELLQNPEIKCASRRASLENVEDVKATGSHTLEVRFKDVYYNAAPMFGLEFSVVPAHSSPRSSDAFNEMKQHVGFGPFRVAQYTEQRLLLSLRDEYRDKPYPLWPWYVEHIEFRYVKDGGNRLEQLRTGKIDVAVVPSGRFETMKKDPEFVKNNWATAYPLPNYEFIAWNARDPDDLDKPHDLFGSAAVRRAMTHVVDRDHIVEKVRHGLARKVNGPYWFKDADYDPSVPELPFDPKKARALLEAEGWELNDQGILERDGRPFRFKLMILNSELWRAPALVVKDGAKQAGIDVELETVASLGELLGRLNDHSFDAFLIRNGLNPPVEPDQYELFHSSFARTKGSNWGGVEDPAIDRMLETIRRTLDPAKRLQMRRQFHRLFDQVHPFTVICCTSSSVGVSRRWSNVKVHDLGLWYRDFQLRR